MTMPDYSKFEGLSAPAVWDAVPIYGKLQIILAIGALEVYSESKGVLAADGQKHYMRGGKPGYFPTFDSLPPAAKFAGMSGLPLFDPFGFTKGKSEEWKARRLVSELNNGRLAMLGLMSLIAEARVPGSVPPLSAALGVHPKTYSGQVMSPFGVEGESLKF